MKYGQDNNNRRQNWTDDNYSWGIKNNPIKTLDDLKKSLQDAIKLELSTIPPYLCALYSIKDGANTFPAFIIRSVVVEEMLHMIMAANILNAIDGKPKIWDEATVTVYPGPLLDIAADFEVGLLPFSNDAIDTFLKIEKPAMTNEQPMNGKFHSIGQFYTAVRMAMETLDAESIKKTGKSIFIGDENKQVKPEHYYGAGGKLVVVKSLDDAKTAIDEIMGQGEGIKGDIGDGNEGAFGRGKEVAHYFRFNEIKMRRYYKDGDSAQRDPTGDLMEGVDMSKVHDMEPNPKMANYRDYPELHEQARRFNKTYMDLLALIDKACNGAPGLIAGSIPVMYKLKEQAMELMRMPIPGNNCKHNAGPGFEYVQDYTPEIMRSKK